VTHIVNTCHWVKFDADLEALNGADANTVEWLNQWHPCQR